MGLYVLGNLLQVIHGYFNIIIAEEYPFSPGHLNTSVALYTNGFFRLYIMDAQVAERCEVGGLQPVLPGVDNDHLPDGMNRLLQVVQQQQHALFSVAGGDDYADVHHNQITFNALVREYYVFGCLQGFSW